MLTVYKKGLRKSWLIGILPPLTVALIIPLISSIWPGENGLKAQAEYFQALLQNDLYKVMLGSLTNVLFTTFEGVILMYIFIWLDWIILFVAIFIPVRIISTEVEKNTLDLILSFPIPRWKYLLQKFSVYLTYNSLYLFLILPSVYICTEILNEEMRYETIIFGLIGVWLILFALGAISLLCSVLMLKTNKSMGLSAIVIIGQYIFTRIGGLIASVNPDFEFIQKLSVFHYLNAGSISTWLDESLEVMLKNFIGEAAVVIAVGLFFTASALYIFQKRELAV
ncbi:MAG: ABC transporter permease subunit [Candidatus Hodarchaeales archaeon]